MASKSALAPWLLGDPSGASATPQRQKRCARSPSPPRPLKGREKAASFSEAILQPTGAATRRRSRASRGNGLTHAVYPSNTAEKGRSAVSAVMSGWGFQPVAPPALPSSSWPTVGPHLSSQCLFLSRRLQRVLRRCRNRSWRTSARQKTFFLW